MCLLRYARHPCTTCGVYDVVYHAGTHTCHLSDGGQLCPETLRQMHNGPTNNTDCQSCTMQAEQSHRTYVRQRVIPGLPAEESRRAIDNWQTDQRDVRDLHGRLSETIYDVARESNGLVLEQPFDHRFADAIGLTPPEGMRIHQYYPRYSTGFYDPERHGSLETDSEPWYPGCESRSASHISFERRPSSPPPRSSTSRTYNTQSVRSERSSRRQNPFQSSESGYDAGYDNYDSSRVDSSANVGRSSSRRSSSRPATSSRYSHSGNDQAADYSSTYDTNTHGSSSRSTARGAPSSQYSGPSTTTRGRATMSDRDLMPPPRSTSRLGRGRSTTRDPYPSYPSSYVSRERTGHSSERASSRNRSRARSSTRRPRRG